MTQYDTSRSDAITAEFLARQPPFRRKVQVFDGEFDAGPAFVFRQLCPAREADWINGWTVELIYTESGGAEPLAVFRTPSTNRLGAGVWILTRVEPDTLLEAVMVHDGKDLLEHIRLDVADLGRDRTKVTWTVTVTALSERGNALVEMMPDATPAFVDELAYFVAHGARKPSRGRRAASASGR